MTISTTRLVSTLTLGLVLVLGAACGGGDKAQPGGGAAKPSSNQEQLVSADFLAQVADETDRIDTLSGEFSMEFGGSGQSFAMSGSMQMDETAMHMNVRMFGERFEILMTPDNMYMNVPGEGWFSVDLGMAGIDREAFGQYFENKGVIDMEALAAALDELEALPNDDIDGTTYAHYRGSYRVEDLLDDPEASRLLNSAGEAAIDGVTGSSNVEFWIDGEALLPRRVVMDMVMQLPSLADEFTMTMTMDFLEFNGEVEIPDIPEDVRDISELE